MRISRNFLGLAVGVVGGAWIGIATRGHGCAGDATGYYVVMGFVALVIAIMLVSD